MMRTVRLYGVLGSKFGREYRFDCVSVQDAMQALCCQLPGFEKFLRNAESMGLRFAVFKGKRNLSEEELILQSGDDDIIRIAPIIEGSKRAGLLQTVIGVALIVVGAMYDWSGTTSMYGAAMIAGGAALGIGGAIQLLSPMPRFGQPDEQDGNNPSTGFSPTTTTAMGHPVPLLYGRHGCGGALNSGGIYTEDAA